jgi:hypothetical protein
MYHPKDNSYLAMFVSSVAAVLLLLVQAPGWMPATLMFAVAAMAVWELLR